jgi:hypothetical protein
VAAHAVVAVAQPSSTQGGVSSSNAAVLVVRTSARYITAVIRHAWVITAL